MTQTRASASAVSERLSGVADAWCTHDRPIEVPCDDSVVSVVDGDIQPIRRSRGYAPLPITLPIDVVPVVATGGELKNTCCVASGHRAWVGQHVGDMENRETLDAFAASVGGFTRMYAVVPEVWAVDAHPRYSTRKWAVERHPDEAVEVQHHHAHVASVMVEHGLDGGEPVFGVAFDGSGYGLAADGSPQIWGGEFLLADYAGFDRVGHLAPLPMPGGDEGVRNPCRVAVAYLHALGIDTAVGSPAIAACDEVELRVVRRQVERNVGCVPTTSMGRLFDVVASLLGVRHRVSYEAQAAIELEALAETARGETSPFRFAVLDDGVVDPRPVLDGIVHSLADGCDPAELARAFHVVVADMITVSARVAAERVEFEHRVALTGGVFQNALLASLARRRLEHEGFEVLTHRLVPPNDGGLSLGQAIVAGVAASSRERS